MIDENCIEAIFIENVCELTPRELTLMIVDANLFGAEPKQTRIEAGYLFDLFFKPCVDESFEKAEHAARQGKGPFEIPYKREMLVIGAWTKELQQREDDIKEIYWKKANECLYLANSGFSPTKNLDEALRLSDYAGRKLPSEEVYGIVLKNDKGFIYSCFGINEVPA